jgi:taurine dioxygenase
MGAEIERVNLRELDDVRFAEIEDALYQHKMIFFRDQALSCEDQENLTARFGEPAVDAYTAGIEGHRNIQGVIKEADQSAKMIFGGSWHTDSSFLQRPPSISLLYGVDIPPYGGDTWWANAEFAYETLSEAMQQMLAPLKVVNSGRGVLAGLRKHSEAEGEVRVTSMDIDVKERVLQQDTAHPLIRTHPVTGKRSLYVDPSYTVGIEGMSAYEASPLLGFLCDHITQPIHTCRLRWEPETLVMWDNRSCLHHAFNDHDGYRREMRRSIVAGEVPA